MHRKWLKTPKFPNLQKQPTRQKDEKGVHICQPGEFFKNQAIDSFQEHLKLTSSILNYLKEHLAILQEQLIKKQVKLFSSK